MIETIRLGMLAEHHGDIRYVAQLQEMLRAQEANGDIRIVFMDDEIATIETLNPVWARLFSDDERKAQ